MVVVVIVSVLVGATVLSVNVGDRARAKEFSNKFTTTMHTLSTEAILSSQSYGIHWNPSARRMDVVCLDNDTGKWIAWNSCSSKESLQKLFPRGKVGLALEQYWGVTFATDLESPALFKFGDVPLSEEEQYQRDIAQEAGLEEDGKPKEITPWMQFRPTGLWEPDGVMQVLVNQRYQTAVRWTATGRVKTVAPKILEEETQ